MERILPASRDTKGIELGNAAYYYAESAEENALAFMSGSNPFIERTSSGGSFTSTGNLYQIAAMTSVVPRAGEGNSEYDKDWNTISPGAPIQLRFNHNLNWSDVNAFKITFRIPNLWTGYTFVNAGSGIINWTLSDGSGAILLGSGAGMITPTEITNSTLLSLTAREGADISSSLSGSEIGRALSIGDFYSDYLGSACSAQKCTIRFSIINALSVISGTQTTTLPYLEYKIQLGSGIQIPEQYASIKTEGYYRGFKKTTVKKIRQLTGNEALDFAVFQ